MQNSGVHVHKTRMSQNVSLPRLRLGKTANYFPVSGITFLTKFPKVEECHHQEMSFQTLL